MSSARSRIPVRASSPGSRGGTRSDFKIRRERADLHEVAQVPGPRNAGRLVEEEIDVDRAVLLTVAACLRLLDDPDDRGVLLGERRLVREVGARESRKASAAAASSASSAKRVRRPVCSPVTPRVSTRRGQIPSRWDRNFAASCPLTLFPAASSGGERCRDALPGAAVTIPPPMPLFPAARCRRASRPRSRTVRRSSSRSAPWQVSASTTCSFVTGFTPPSASVAPMTAESLALTARERTSSCRGRPLRPASQ